MKLSDENRCEMVRHHLSKATQMLELADELVRMGHYDAACNRYYYACFHGAHALFVANELSAKTHEGMLTVFGKEFVLTEKMDKKYGILLTRLEQLRKKADYNCVANISEQEVITIGQPAREFLQAVTNELSA